MRLTSIATAVLAGIVTLLLAQAHAHSVPAPAGQLFISTVTNLGQRDALLPMYYVFSYETVDHTKPCQPKIARLGHNPAANERGAYATVEPATITFNPAGEEVYDLAHKDGKWRITNSNDVLVGTCYPMVNRFYAQCASNETIHYRYLGRVEWACVLIIPMKI